MSEMKILQQILRPPPPGCLTFSKQVRDESSERLLQVELDQLHGLQSVCFLFLRRPPTSSLEQ